MSFWYTFPLDMGSISYNCVYFKGNLFHTFKSNRSIYVEMTPHLTCATRPGATPDAYNPALGSRPTQDPRRLDATLTVPRVCQAL